MRELIDSLARLKAEHHLVGVKGGTEVEAMTFDEIALLREASASLLPMTVKIGGPEARNDIDFMVDHGVDTLLAPMIESVYGLRNFVEAARSLDPDRRTSLAVNMETITALDHLEELFASPWFAELAQVTVGRSDLSGSMGRGVDDPEVFLATARIVALAARYGKRTSVGGQITPENACMIQDRVRSDYVNTRHMSVSCTSPELSGDVAAALGWEAEFYRFLYERFPRRRALYLSRISSIEARRLIQPVMA